MGYCVYHTSRKDCCSAFSRVGSPAAVAPSLLSLLQRDARVQDWWLTGEQGDIRK